MTGVRIEVDDKALRGALAQLAGLGADMTRPLREIGGYLVSETNLRFEAERGPGGLPWKKSGRALAQGGQTLNLSGDLKRSITMRVGARELTVGTKLRYAAIHQFGGTIRAKTSKGLRFRLPWLKGSGDNGWRRVQSVTLPARPFLGVDATDRDEILLILDRHIRRIAAGGAPA